MLGNADDDVSARALIEGHQPFYNVIVEPSVAPPGTGVDDLAAAQGGFRGAYDEEITLDEIERIPVV